MRLKILVAIFILFCFPFISYADTQLLGYDCSDDQLDCADYEECAPFTIGVWKAIRFQATSSGDADYIKVCIKYWIGDADRTDDIAYAIYEDDGGATGDLKVSGYTTGYQWSTVGENTEHSFDLDTIHSGKNRTIVSGTYYWVTVQTDAGEPGDPADESDVTTARRQSGATQLKRGTIQNPMEPANPPASQTNVYGDGRYGWAIWDDDSNTETIKGISIQ